jgi:uncharacterized protein YdeI (YjbR/CyaY-like superfamily)
VGFEHQKHGQSGLSDLTTAASCRSSGSARIIYGMAGVLDPVRLSHTLSRALPTPRDIKFFESAAALRAWFEENHETAKDLWVGFHKKRTGRPSITWQELVDEELCFGWIDSVRYGLGDDRSAQRVTPRRKRSVWSAVNIRRFEQLDSKGVVHAAGRAAFDRRDEARSRVYSYEAGQPQGLDAGSEAAFRRHRSAWRFFEGQPPSYRRTAGHWVTSAKRPETRARRLGVLIESSQKNERIPLLRRP